MKKRITLMMMVVCILMCIPQAVKATDYYIMGSFNTTGAWTKLDGKNMTRLGNTNKYSQEYKCTTGGEYRFRFVGDGWKAQMCPNQSSYVLTETSYKISYTDENDNAYKDNYFIVNMESGKTYTFTFDDSDKDNRTVACTVGGSTSPSEMGIQLFNGTSPLTGSNGKYTLDLMRSAAADATIKLTIDGENYGLTDAQTIEAAGTTKDIAFTKGGAEALTLKKGFIYSLTVTEDGKMTVVAKKGVADGNYYLVGNFFDEDGEDINYNKKYFRFINNKGNGTLTFDIPASLSIKAQIYTSDGTCYGPADAGLGGISNTNPKADATDKSVSGELVAGDNFWTFLNRGLKEIGIYTITITVDADGKPTEWKVTYDDSKRMAYFLVDPTEDPDAVVHPAYAVLKNDHGCDNKFFGNIYLKANQHCFVVGNIMIDPEYGITGQPRKTTEKLYLQGNGGYDPTMEGNSTERDMYTHVYPTKTKGFIFSDTKSVVLEYNPTKGSVTDGDGNHGIGGEIIKASSQITDEPIKSVQIVGNGVVDSWLLKDAKEMTYNIKLDCWECTITTNKSESKENKFRFIANGDWKINWGENSKLDSEQARVPYTDERQAGHEASLKDPNELGFTTKGTKENRDGAGTFGDMIFNRPAGVWTIRLYIRTIEDATGNNYVARHAYTITGSESKDIDLTYRTGKFIRTYSNDKPMNPKNDNVKIYEVYSYKRPKGGNADNIYEIGTVYLRQLKYVPANVGVVLIGEAPTDTYTDGGKLAFSLLERTEESVKPGGDYREVWTKYQDYKEAGDKWNNYLVPTVEAVNDLGNATVDNDGNITYRYYGLGNYYRTKRHQSLGAADTQEDYIGFFRLTAKGSSDANKAYLSIPANAVVGGGVGKTYGYIDYNGRLLGNNYDDSESTMPAKFANMALVFDDMVDGNETTGIKELETEKMNNNKYYNLQGIEVAHPVKGIYIHNGKKVIVK